MALVADAVTRRSTLEGQPALTLVADGRQWEVAGDGDPVRVAGSLAQVVAYVTGRAPLGPDQPAWL